MAWLQQAMNEHDCALTSELQASENRRFAVYVSVVLVLVLIAAIETQRYLNLEQWHFTRSVWQLFELGALLWIGSVAIGHLLQRLEQSVWAGWWVITLGFCYAAWQFPTFFLPTLSLFLFTVIMTLPCRRAMYLVVARCLGGLMGLLQAEAYTAGVLLRYWAGSIVFAGLTLGIVYDACHISSLQEKKLSIVRVIGLSGVLIPLLFQAAELIAPVGANSLVNTLSILISLAIVLAIKFQWLMWSYVLVVIVAAAQMFAFVVAGERSLPLLSVFLFIGFVFLPARWFGLFSVWSVAMILLYVGQYDHEDEWVRSAIFVLSQLLVWIGITMLLPLWSGRTVADHLDWRTLIKQAEWRRNFFKIWLGFIVISIFTLWPLIVMLQRQTDVTFNNLYGIFFILLLIYTQAWLAWLVLQNTMRAEQLAVMAQRASDSAAAKARFLSTLSHEMRTPLNGLLGMLQVLEVDQALTRVQGTNLKLLRYSGEQLYRTVEDVIDIARVEQGKLTLNPVLTDVGYMVSRIYMFLHQEAQLKGVILQLSNRLPKGVTATIDEARCIQVVEFVGSRMLGHAGRGERIELIFSLGLDGINVQFISANSEQVLAEIPLDDASPVVDSEAISVKVMHLLGVSLSLHTQRTNQQQAILLEIPMMVDVPLQEPVKPTTIEAMPRPRVDPGKLKILIVDDESSNLMVMKLALEKHYANIEQANGGQNALDLMALQTFDLVISDISMPGMSGEQLLQHMRAIGIETPVIALTGNLSDDDNRRFLSEGFERVLHKPVDLAKLRQAVAEILSA